MFPAGLKLVKQEASFPDTKTSEILALQRAQNECICMVLCDRYTTHAHVDDLGKAVSNTAGKACVNNVVESCPPLEPDASLPSTVDRRQLTIDNR
ncbi:hypothetical protein GJ744_010483 [Endocarpon pusillum]|uniref:Uncharacterized protein n=1 Tax=Endocarpon pusillum TaxID=364733 RepID=A0A8H7AHA4_9EURO|nr:hypothetical protein GJ744_010483 [Endocarpon pusillum]